MKGDQMERELMAVLRDHGFIPMRSPGSGTGDWEQPDVLAAQQGIVMATELKSGKRPKNVQDREVDALDRFADAFWAASLIAVRYSGDRTFYLARPDAMDRTPSDHYSIPGDESRLPWAVALPYRKGDDGIEARKDVGNEGVVFATDEDAPGLADWLDVLTAEQQGFQTRRGIVDMKIQEREGVNDDTE